MNSYIELHLHLDGAITVDIARKLAAAQSIILPTEDDKELEKLLSVPSDCTSLNEFLKCFDLPLSLLQTKQGISDAVMLVMDNIKKQGVIYAELRYAPQLHKQKGLTQENAVVAALEGLERSDLAGNLILCCMRGNDNQAENIQTVELAHTYLTDNGGVVALDLAGAEALCPTGDYKDVFKLAREHDIPFTIHAGEAAGADSVRSAIEQGASRIGHGVRIMEDESVMQLVRDKAICLEMCPTSNRQTVAVSDMNDYPLKRYIDYGIKVAVCTDDMAICRTTLAEEHDYIRSLCGITTEQERQLYLNAVEAAFTDEKTKSELRKLV